MFPEISPHMKIYQLAQQQQSPKSLATVYRVCIARQNPQNPAITEFKSLYNPNPKSPETWTPIQVGQVLKGKWYVGTKVKFCMAYYSGASDLENGEKEILVTLNVPANLIPSEAEDSYMGSEAVVENPMVIKIENVDEVSIED
jgi:hypothetical protein